ncbi:hypothetical protein GCM10027040_21950 [Halomonas shantousis]
MLEQHRSGSRHDALLAITPDERDGDAWMVSYIDILTLLVALFVLLLAVSGQASSLGGLFRQGAPVSDDTLTAVTISAPPVMITPMAQHAALAVVQPVEPTDKTSMDTLPLAEGAIAAAVGVVGVDSITPHAQAAAIRVAEASSISDAALEAARQVAASPSIDPQALATAVEVAEALEKSQETMALPSIDGVEVSRIKEGINLRIQDHLLFDSADAALTDSGREVIQRLVTMLNQFDGTISVEGHSDSRPINTPRFPSNWELSSMRATSILRYLSDAGVDASRMRAIGYADTHPIASNDTLQGRAANRRVEVIVHETR